MFKSFVLILKNYFARSAVLNSNLDPNIDSIPVIQIRNTVFGLSFLAWPYFYSGNCFRYHRPAGNEEEKKSAQVRHVTKYLTIKTKYSVSSLFLKYSLELPLPSNWNRPKIWLRIRIQPTIWIRIRIQPTIWIRIRILFLRVNLFFFSLFWQNFWTLSWVWSCDPIIIRLN